MFGLGKKKRYWEEDDYESAEEEAAEEDENLSLGMQARPRPLGWIDAAIAAALGVLAFALLSAWTYDGLHPSVWTDCAVAAGLREPASLAPGLWRPIGGLIFNSYGIDGGAAATVTLGRIVLGVIVALAYLSFKEMLSILVRPPATERKWARVLSRVVCAVTSVLFLFSDPVWTLGYSFGHTQLCILIFSISVFLLAHFLAAGTIPSAYWAMFTLGLLCAETPLGFIALAVFWAVFYALLTKGGLFHVQLLEPLKQQSSKWYLTFFWAGGVLGGIAANVASFSSMGGMEGAGITSGDVPLEYVKCLFEAFGGAANYGAWIIGSGLAVLPFVLSIALLRRAVDLEHFLSYHVGIVFFTVGMIAYSQICCIQPLWFWTWHIKFGAAMKVGSPVILFICSLMTASAVLCALSVVTVDVFCRNHRQIISQINSDNDENKTRFGLSLWLKIFFFAMAAVLLVAGALPGRKQTGTRTMMAMIDDYVKEIVNEADGAKWLFSDGAFDCAVEMEAKKRGKELACISLNPGPGRRSVHSIKQVMLDEEDKLAAGIGEANLLRTWQRDKPERMAESGIMVGLDLWRQRGGTDYPPISGVMARTKWPDDAMRQEGIDAAKALAGRVISFVEEEGGPKPIAGEQVKDLFYIMQWRLARMASMRSEMYDRGGDAEKASIERDEALKLDDTNAELKRLREKMMHARSHTLRQMSPREGLHLALVRADFLVGRHFAEPILESAPDNIDANFAMGMSFFVQEQYAMAEKYLLRCTELRPSEPAFWNNLALTHMQLKRYMQALEEAQKALELIPDSAEVKDTIKTIEEAKVAAEESKESQGGEGTGNKAGAAGGK